MQNLLTNIILILQSIDDEKILGIIYSFILGLTQDE